MLGLAVKKLTFSKGRLTVLKASSATILQPTQSCVQVDSDLSTLTSTLLSDFPKPTILISTGTVLESQSNNPRELLVSLQQALLLLA